MKRGFDRLRGVAAASAMGLGLLGGGSARAITASLLPRSVTAGTAFWSSIANLGSTPFASLIMDGQSLTTSATVGKFSLVQFSNPTPSTTATLTNSAFGIFDASTSSGFDFYDSGMLLAVDGVLFVNPDTTVDTTSDSSGITINSDTVTGIVTGIDAQVQYFFDNSRAVVRALYTLTNTTGSNIPVKALVMGNYGSNLDTTVQATQSGDLVVTGTDRWVISNDNTTIGGDGINDPTATIAASGSFAQVMPVAVMKPGTTAGGASAGPDNFGYRYDVTVPANGTVRVMLFSEMSATLAAAQIGAADFESLAAADAAGLLSGLTTTQRSQIVNYGEAPPPPSTSSKSSSGLFALGVPGLLGMLGPLLLLRRRPPRED